jgi:hypothetical protein
VHSTFGEGQDGLKPSEIDYSKSFYEVMRSPRRWLRKPNRFLSQGRGKDEVAVRAAIPLPWSNGQTEGQITRLRSQAREAAAVHSWQSISRFVSLTMKPESQPGAI